MNEWLPILKMSVPFLLLFGVAEALYHFKKVTAEVTRKMVHIGTGLLTLLFPDVFRYLWQVVVICTLFFLLLLLSMRYHLLPSVNAVSRKTRGSILFPVVVIIVFAFYLFMEQQSKAFYPTTYFCLPLLIMSVADPVAAAVGNHYKQNKKNRLGKTVNGSIAFFITALLMSAIFLSLASQINTAPVFFPSLLIAFATTLAERFSSKGWDNFTIPLTTAGLLYLIA